MSQLNQTRAEILETLLQKNIEGVLSWISPDGEESLQTSIGDFSFHLDKKSGVQSVYFKVWVFGKDAEVLDSFTTLMIKDIAPRGNKFADYTQLAKFVYNTVQDKVTLTKITPALGKLKSIT